MLLALAQWLAQDVRFFNVFNYITLRAVLAAMTALLISLWAGPGVIRWLAAKKIGQAVRTDGPQRDEQRRHRRQHGTQRDVVEDVEKAHVLGKPLSQGKQH